MPNPYAARRRSRRGTGTTFPAGRFRQAGIVGDDLNYWRDVFESLDADDRADQLAAWESMDDSEFVADVTLSMTGVPDGTPPAAPNPPGNHEPASLHDQVPSGSVPSILSWVTAVDGNARLDRANAALDVELAGANRVTLIDPLRELTLRRG